VPTIPSRHQLRAALFSARLIDPSGSPLDNLRRSYHTVPSGGLISSEDARMGEELLIGYGLATCEAGTIRTLPHLRSVAMMDDPEASKLLFHLMFESDPPPWLAACTADDTVATELIPDADLNAMSGVLTPEEREELLLNLGRKFQQENNEQVGNLAEEYLEQALKEELSAERRADLADQVCRVSLDSDQLGYDLTAPRLDGSTRRIEAKGTRSTGSIAVFFLSRNEANTGARDPDWALVVCRVQDAEVETLGWMPYADLEPHIPADRGPHSQWQSVKIRMPVEQVKPGLPPVRSSNGVK